MQESYKIARNNIIIKKKINLIKIPTQYRVSAETLAVNMIIKIFGWPLAETTIALAEIYDGQNSQVNNFNKKTIFKYLNRGDRLSIVVFYNGNTD